MGIFDILKKLFKEKKVEEIVIEKLNFSNIGNWIEDKTKENEHKEKEIIQEIKEKIENFIEDFKDKITALENFDIEAKKEKEEIKNIVSNSREKYIESTESLIEKLQNIREPKLKQFMAEINKIFLDFNKSSYKNYERATILVGKEMAGVKESVKSFSRELLKTYEENKGITEFFKTISEIKIQHQNINSIKNTLKTIIEKKEFLNKKIDEKEEETNTLKKEIEEIKKSQSYADYLDSQKKEEYLKSEVKRNILELKQLIDFKILSSFFHINPEQMKTVKKHREDFYTFFLEDGGESVIKLLDEVKLNNLATSEKIKKIHFKLEEIQKHKEEIKHDKTKEVYQRIKKVTIEVDELKIEEVKEKKREEKLQINKEDLVHSLKNGFEKLNVEII